MNRNQAAVMGLAAAALMAGCTTEASEGTVAPSAPVSTSPAVSTGSDVPGVPTVNAPLDIDSFLEQPCTSLTAEQIARYIGEDTEQRSDPDGISGPSCSWGSPPPHDARIAITYPRITEEGLTALYRNRDQNDFFEEVSPIDGYPAIAYGLNDRRDEGECLVTVGTSDSAYVNVHLYLGNSSVGEVDPCAAAHEVATAVIGNIQATN